MTNGFIWFFSISGFVLGFLGLLVGVWDLTVDLEDREQDKNALTYSDEGEGDKEWRRKNSGLLKRLKTLIRYARRLPK